MKIVSWNVNGIRAAVKKDFIAEFKKIDADIFCIQETKAQDDQVAEALSDLGGYTVSSNSAERKGYSGVSTITKSVPAAVTRDIGVKVYDQEGRVVSVDMGEFFLINAYVPNSGNGLKRLDYRSKWDKSFSTYLKKQMAIKPIVVTGDLNVAHEAIDLARPKSNYNKTAGYTQVEIDGMDRILNLGLIDSFRKLHPEKVQYTFWSLRFGGRQKNIGWRIDYFLVDKRLFDRVKSCSIHEQIMGSDHCPLSLDIDI